MVHITPQNASALSFDDGNIILRADTTTVRVHQSVLSHHSSVFRQMWADAPAFTRGLLTVLLDDRSGDLVHYIAAVYHINSGVDARGPISMAEVGSLLRMGRKYAHVGMFASMADRVTSEYPAALSAFDYARRNPFTEIEECPGFQFQLLALAYANDLYASVPPLLYDICAKFSSEELRAGAVYGNGETVKISARDQILCNVGRDRLAAAQSKHTFAWVESLPGANCFSPESCEEVIAAVKASLYGPVRKTRALDVWDEDWEIALCRPCGEAAQKVHCEGRKAIWGKLPAYFDLGEWEDVCRLQEDLVNLVMDVNVTFM
ncbi:hypothetical protein FPV67DRAFT_1448536 [Lyophyllum atratum]|nr:hypothetical protein FPV67DRAFT_1448536 [Lyophyllum atratum]